MIDSPPNDRAYLQLGQALLGAIPIILLALAIGFVGKATGYNQALYQLLVPNLVIIALFLGVIARFPDVLPIRQALALYLAASVAPYLIMTPFHSRLSGVGLVLVDVLGRGVIMGGVAVYLGSRYLEPIPRRSDSPNWLPFMLKVFGIAFVPFALFNLSATELFKLFDIDVKSNVDEMANLMTGDPLGAIAIPVLVAVVAPIYEELFFRFLLFRLFREQLGFPIAAGLSALIFATAHGNPLVICGTGVLGLLFAWVYERTGSIAAPIGYHMLWNGTSLVLFKLGDGLDGAHGAKSVASLIATLQRWIG